MERAATQVTPNGDENSGQFVMTTFLLFSLCLYLLLMPCIVMENRKYLTIGGINQDQMIAFKLSRISCWKFSVFMKN